MKEYIEKEAARDLMEQALADEWEIQYADDRLDEIPAADVVEVRHGRWEPDEFWRNHDIDYCVCSACQKYWIHNGDQYDFNYCPNCGAKMDGGVNDAAD
jgi:hypothetical protein